MTHPVNRPSWDSPPVTVVDLPALAATNPAPKETAMPTDLDAAIVDHLTRAQRHWLACQEHGLDDRNEMRYHATGHAYEVSVVFLLQALARYAPDNVEAIYVDLDGLLHHAPLSAEWTWEMLQQRDMDPSGIAAFKALNHREHPGTGKPMAAIERPADGTTSELSGEPEAHARTSHGHPCCGKAPSERPNAIARCGGPGMCKVCAAGRDAIHGATA